MALTLVKVGKMRGWALLIGAVGESTQTPGGDSSSAASGHGARVTAWTSALLVTLLSPSACPLGLVNLQGIFQEDLQAKPWDINAVVLLGSGAAPPHERWDIPPERTLQQTV